MGPNLASWTGKAKKFYALSAIERRTLYAAFRRLFIARLDFGRKTADEIFASLSHRKRNPGREQKRSDVSIQKVGWAVGLAARHVPWQADCLVQALAAHRWLWDYGYAPSLFIGVAGQGNGLSAHAWLECDGVMVTGGGSTLHYATLPFDIAKTPLDGCGLNPELPAVNPSCDRPNISKMNLRRLDGLRSFLS